ncbi:hypothetical protein ACTXGQ_29745, partial [Marinobacter sp. 1Y8]
DDISAINAKHYCEFSGDYYSIIGFRMAGWRPVLLLSANKVTYVIDLIKEKSSQYTSVNLTMKIAVIC